MTRKIVFFGASEAARQALRDWPADLPVSYFVDNDRGKWGRIFEGLPVKSPAVLDAEPFDSVFVVIATLWYEEIARQLETTGLIRDMDFAQAGEAERVLRQLAPRDRAPHEVVALQFEDHWFGIDYARLRELCTASRIRYVRARVPLREGGDESLAFDRSSYRSIKCHGVPLYDACLFDACVACGATPDRLDPADPSHWPVIVQHMRGAAAVAKVASKSLDDERPDVVVIPQGHTTIGAVYRYAAVLRGIRVIAIENSLNSARLVWDDIAGIAVNKIPARNYYWRWTDLVDETMASDHVRSYLSSIKHAKTDDHQSPRTPWPGAARSGRTVLYLANVLTDSSILFNSRVGSQVDAIKAAARWAIEHDCTFILKIHPRERPGSPLLRRHFPPAEFSYDGLTVRALQEDAAFWNLVLTSDRCAIDADNRFDTYDLIRRSDVCVTVCSQAGLEALMLGKETVVLGDAYYGGLGFTHDVHDIAQLGAALLAALSPAGRRVDAGRIAKFFYILDRVYSIEKSADGLAALIQRTLGRSSLPILPATA